jgi:hypothetical protein
MKSGVNIIHYSAPDNLFSSRAGAGAQTVGFQEFIQRVLTESLRPTL